MTGRPDPKPVTAGGIGKPKPARKYATAGKWGVLHAEKGGPCRLCGELPYVLHHALSKARGGPDETWNLIPLCRRHHDLIHQEDAAAKFALGSTLTDEEYAGLIQFAGEQVIWRLFGPGVSGSPGDPT